jgi:hypothetical protein
MVRHLATEGTSNWGAFTKTHTVLGHETNSEVRRTDLILSMFSEPDELI